jgi:hypothetical protein
LTCLEQKVNFAALRFAGRLLVCHGRSFFAELVGEIPVLKRWLYLVL